MRITRAERPATTLCPIGPRCESCGRSGMPVRAYLFLAQLMPAAGGKSLEVCVTLCTLCCGSSQNLPLREETLRNIAADHAKHARGVESDRARRAG
jgi:hypothetical protein